MNTTTNIDGRATLTAVRHPDFEPVAPNKQLMVWQDPDAPLVAPARTELPSFRELTRRRRARTTTTAMQRHFEKHLENLMMRAAERAEEVDPRDIEKLLAYADAEAVHGELGDYSSGMKEWVVAGANIAMATGMALDVGTKIGSPEEVIAVLATAAAAWVAADLGSGFPFHWGVDVLGSPKTPLVGQMIAEFQKHHVAPREIGEGDFAGVTYSTGKGLAVVLGLFSLGMASGYEPSMITETALVAFSLGILNAQNFHRWTHAPKDTVPRWVKWMQDHGLAVSREEHLRHHRAPHEGNYCLVTGMWNKLLDDSKVARWAEKMAFQLSRGNVRPTTWIAGKNCEAIREEALHTTLRDVLRNTGRSLMHRD